MKIPIFILSLFLMVQCTHKTAPETPGERSTLKISETDRNTFEINWGKGKLEINLIPVNRYLPTSSPVTPCFDEQLLCAHDNVGIVSLQLDSCPPVPRILWDNREHHFWQGFNGGFRPRNTTVNDIRVHQSDDKRSVSVSCYYIVDFVKTTITWVFQEPEEEGVMAQWDTYFEFENLNKFTLVDYMSFFACYHKAGQNWFWDTNNELAECADSFKGYPSEKVKNREEVILIPFTEMVKSWKGAVENPTRASVLYGKPVLISDRCDWFNGGRHVIFVEPEKCVSIVNAMTQARDYMLAPPQKDLE
ncbi:MAG: hypothetical protein ABFS38_22320, partial [Bacteroidota bacterium]